MTVNSGQPFAVGENVLLPVVRELISAVLEKDPLEAMKSLPLSNNTASRRTPKKTYCGIKGIAS